jgi:hypothetical protein
VRPRAVGDGGVGGLDQGPVIPAGPLGAGPGGEPLPGPRGQTPGQLDRRTRADPGGDRVALGHGQDIAQTAAGQLDAQLRVLAVDLMAVTHAAGVPASRARPIIVLASAGLVANAGPAGTPAARHRAGSPVQDFGRYRARSMNAVPAGAA